MSMIWCDVFTCLQLRVFSSSILPKSFAGLNFWKILSKQHLDMNTGGTCSSTAILFLQMIPVKRCYFVKRSLWQALLGWLFLIIKDEISTTPKTLQNTYTTAMTQNNLYTILGDLKQDVEVDTTGILPLFFPFSILVKSILVWIYFSCITYNLCSVSPPNRCRMIGYMEPSVPFLSLFLSVSLRVN